MHKFLKLKYQMVVLTPIHIGSGEELDPFRFLIKNDYAHHIRYNQFVNYLIAKDKDTLFKLLKESNLKNLIRYLYESFDPDNVALYSVRYQVLPEIQEQYIKNIAEERNQTIVSEFIRSALKEPYIPGSSIKGAIRTAIISKLDSGTKVNPRDSDYETELLGSYRDNGYKHVRDMSLDPFKYIKLADAPLITNDIRIRYINRSYVHKDQVIPFNMAETLLPRASEKVAAITTLSLNFDFFGHKQIKDIFGASLPDPTERLYAFCSWINSYYKQKLEQDIERTTNPKLKNSMKAVLGQFDGLVEGSFIMKLGKGSGQNYLKADSKNFRIPITKSTVDDKIMGWCKFLYTSQ